MSTRHTDLPWKIVEDGYPVESYVIRYNNCSNQGYFVARFFVKDAAVNSPFDAKANAEFIIRAANNFDALLEACKSALVLLDMFIPSTHGEEEGSIRDRIVSAIRKAEVKS